MDNFLFLKNKEILEILDSIKYLIPNESELYVIGGTIRNGVYNHYFNKDLPQRDFDLVFFGDRYEFEKKLVKNGFSKELEFNKEQVVYKKELKDSKELFFEGIYLDIHFKEKQDLKDMLKNNINFTFQGIMLEYKYLFEKDWFTKLIYLDNSLVDLKNKNIIINKFKSKIHNTTFYSCLRLVYLGFNPPNNEDLKFLADNLKGLSNERLLRNKKKLLDYVGGDSNLKVLLEELKIRGDIFSQELINNQNLTISK